MKKLTPSQLSDVQNLMDDPLISQASVDFHSNGLMRVTIISKPDVELFGIDTFLRKVFPGMEYRGAPAIDDDSELHFIDYNGETLINLLMKKAPAPTEAEKENSHLDCTIEHPEVESLKELCEF
ncbi:hypothetical protein [Desulfosporosinus nitroreducens]|uniref:hypothetical protein n=1 Tax=Desulfosporosinus nitroreducens TaxID=2018668 RepID=UPI00207C967A|nr:hypothetical protein [Desulfosporosinus nitroreducens]MCO1599857.1 hypothetical protein [Desulfosporosinus nitroreducens]